MDVHKVVWRYIIAAVVAIAIHGTVLLLTRVDSTKSPSHPVDKMRVLVLQPIELDPPQTAPSPKKPTDDARPLQRRPIAQKQPAAIGNSPTSTANRPRRRRHEQKTKRVRSRRNRKHPRKLRIPKSSTPRVIKIAGVKSPDGRPTSPAVRTPTPHRRLLQAPPLLAPVKRSVQRPMSMTPYISKLSRHIGRFKRYPGTAKRLQLQGTTRLLLKIMVDGTLLLNPTLLRSSGHTMLDQAAIAIAKRAQPYPTLPDGFAKRHFRVIVPLSFELDDDDDQD